MEPIAPTDPETQSADVLAGNIERLGELFPEVMADGAVDFEALRQLLGDAVDDSDERFGLSWHGKRRARQFALTPSTGTLRPCPEESVDWDTTQNLIIEGDNLEVLKLLQKSYAGKVKLIYIDPPYNTGKDFVYPDNFNDSIANYLALTGQADDDGHKLTSNTEASGRFHTDWLNMMYPRLKLARGLLRHDGVALISIDDSELGRLRSLCDEVFGARNFCGVIKRRAARKTAFLSKRMSDLCDYVVAYVASDAAPPLTAGQVSDGTRPVLNAGNANAERILRAGAPARCEDGTYPPGTYAAKSTEFTLLDMLEVKDGKVVAPVTIRGPWRINQEVLDQTLYVTRSVGLRRTVLPEELEKAKLLSDLLDDNHMYNERGSEELQDLFGSPVFSNPKPWELVSFLAAATSVGDGDIVLDFFAGSGTTGHAVMARNAADSSSARYVLVQLPEPLDPAVKEQEVAAGYCDELGAPRTIAELTKERLRRAGVKVAMAHPDYEGDLGFRVFKLDSSNIRAWEPHPEDLELTLEQAAEHLKPDRSEQDVLYEILLKLGLDLCVPIQTTSIKGLDVHAIGGGVLVACLSEAIADDSLDDVATGVAAWVTDLQPAGDTTCVFRDSAFTDDVAKTNLTATLAQAGITTVRSI